MVQIGIQRTRGKRTNRVNQAGRRVVECFVHTHSFAAQGGASWVPVSPRRVTRRVLEKLYPLRVRRMRGKCNAKP